MQKLVRGYAEERDGRWEAICLDYDLAVQGESLPEAIDLLEKAVADYHRYVESLPETERESFLRRRAPLWHWLRFYAGA